MAKHGGPVFSELKEYILECAALEEERESWEQQDIILKPEIPKSLSVSGWMRNDREANEYEQKLQRMK